MNNSQENKKLNDKGFSLVELIIVIAIMAVLVGVLAPQYIKYVEKSRVATDQDNVSAIMSAIQVYAVDTTATVSFQDGDKIVISSSSVDTTGDNGAISAALTNANITAQKLVNTQTYSKVTIEVDVTDGVVTVKDTWTEMGSDSDT